MPLQLYLFEKRQSCESPRRNVREGGEETLNPLCRLTTCRFNLYRAVKVCAKPLGLCWLALTITACVPGSQQVNNIMAGVGRFQNDQHTTSVKGAWTLRFGSYTSQVNPVEINGRVVFRNAIGDTVEIENANVEIVRDLGRFDYLWQIQTSGVAKMYYEQGDLTMTVECAPWRIDEAETLEDLSARENESDFSAATNVAVMYTQVCRSTPENTLIVNKYGYRSNMEMVFIQSAVGAGQPPLILQKN